MKIGRKWMKNGEIVKFRWKKRRKWPKNEHFGASPKGPPEFPALKT